MPRQGGAAIYKILLEEKRNGHLADGSVRRHKLKCFPLFNQ
jgi:hypothetical protein